MKTRVRFAPSPTGLLHVGNARTALYNWLFARHTGGTFVLRIEDTDVARSEVRHEAQLMEDLLWLGLGWDEGPGAATDAGDFGPYRQSDRLEIYASHTRQLLAEDKAYRCFCTPEQLEADRAKAVAEHRPQVYSGRCSRLSGAEQEARVAAGEGFAVRLRVPDAPLAFEDIVRGPVEFPAETIGDPILVRSVAEGGQAVGGFGMPVYNYVVTIDDALMQMTHVIRGDDHISNTPRQVAIYRAFGWPVPKFAHLSTILGSDRERLSKRHGATSVASFREMGILPEALVNYLALLGWGDEDGKTEIFSLEELAQRFSLERVTASPAVFDWDKLHWLNRHYLKEAPLERVRKLAWGFFPELGEYEGASEDLKLWFERLLQLLLPAVDRLDQLPEKAAFLLRYDAAAARSDAANAEVMSLPGAHAVLAAFRARVKAHSGKVTPVEFKAWMNEVKAETGAKGKELFHPVRVALTGSHSGPEFDRLVPLMEEGAALGAPLQVLSVRARLEAFTA